MWAPLQRRTTLKGKSRQSSFSTLLHNTSPPHTCCCPLLSNLYTYDIFQRHCFGNYYGKLGSLQHLYVTSHNILTTTRFQFGIHKIDIRYPEGNEL